MRDRDADFRSMADSPPSDPQEHQVCVRRLDAGWCVEGDGFERLMFRAGSQAERQARGLARGFACCGCDTCVRVLDAQGLLVATIRYYGAEVPGRGLRE